MDLIELKTKPWYKVYQEMNIEIPVVNDRPLGDYVSDFAQQIPGNPALQYFTRTITYAELDTEANKLANALKASGIKKGGVIGLHMPNIPAYVIALIAISKLGAIGTGLSPLLMPTELLNQIEDAKVELIISVDALSPALKAIEAFPSRMKSILIASGKDYLTPTQVELPDLNGLNVFSFMGFIEGQSEDFRAVTTHWNDTFMIQYTGGTTGKPKGAQLSIRGLMNNPTQAGTCAPEPVIGKEVYASAFPFFHVAGLSGVITSLMIGGHTFLIPNPRDIDNFCALMLSYPPTRFGGVPALYEMLMANEKFKQIDFSKLLVASTGAAPMSPDTASRLISYIGENKLSDVFGMTETSPCYSMHPPARRKDGSVGIPVPLADVRIIDTSDGVSEMPVNEPGEICSSGLHVMKGYLNLPEETENALRTLDGKTWMFSGDIGYMDSEGYVFLCDRAKDMLIVGGYKVFSVEVEDKLSSLPQIAACAIIGTKDEKRPGNDIVNLCVELAPDFKEADPEDIKSAITEYCRKVMSAFKVPKRIHIIDAIPLTAVGKVDKVALRKNVD